LSCKKYDISQRLSLSCDILGTMYGMGWRKVALVWRCGHCINCKPFVRLTKGRILYSLVVCWKGCGAAHVHGMVKGGRGMPLEVGGVEVGLDG